MSGRVEAIWRKPARREPMERLEEARLVEGEGLAGNHHRGGRRQVTIIAREAWRRAEEALRPEWRGGVYGEVASDGEIRVGDSVGWLPGDGAG